MPMRTMRPRVLAQVRVLPELGVLVQVRVLPPLWLLVLRSRQHFAVGHSVCRTCAVPKRHVSNAMCPSTVLCAELYNH